MDRLNFSTPLNITLFASWEYKLADFFVMQQVVQHGTTVKANDFITSLVNVTKSLETDDREKELENINDEDIIFLRVLVVGSLHFEDFEAFNLLFHM